MVRLQQRDETALQLAYAIQLAQGLTASVMVCCIMHIDSMLHIGIRGWLGMVSLLCVKNRDCCKHMTVALKRDGMTCCMASTMCVEMDTLICKGVEGDELAADILKRTALGSEVNIPKGVVFEMAK